MAALAGRAMVGEARIGLQPLETEGHRRQRIEGSGKVVQHDRDHALDQVALDRGVGAAFDPHGRGAAAAAQQHVDDRVDQGAVDGQQAVVVPFLGLEHGQHGRQRDRIQIVAEARRGDAVEADLDVVRGEVAQRGRHHAHQPVEHHLEHRQALVGHHRRVDDGIDAGAVAVRDRVIVQAKQAVDFALIQDPRGAGVAGGLACPVASRPWRPIRPSGHPFRRPPASGPASAWTSFSSAIAYCTSISRNKTSRTTVGWAAELTRSSSSSRSRWRPAEP